MKKIILPVLLIIYVLCLQTERLYSALGDFKQGVEREETEKSKKSGRSSSSSSSSSYSDDNDGCGEFMGELFLYAIAAWGVHNFQLRYNKYPYQFSDSNNFIFNMMDINDSQRIIPEENNESNTGAGKEKPLTISAESMETENVPSAFNKGSRYEDKNYYYTLDAGGQYAFDEGTGYYAVLRGKFYKLIGPEIEVKRIKDDNDYLDYYAFGLNIPVCQFSGFLPDFYVQKTYLKGILERDGWSYGIIINSYPVKPLSFMIRIGKQSYNNIKGENYGNIDFIDYEGRVGVLFNRLEIYAGYRHLGAKYAKIRGPLFGLKVFI